MLKLPSRAPGLLLALGVVGTVSLLSCAGRLARSSSQVAPSSLSSAPASSASDSASPSSVSPRPAPPADAATEAERQLASLGASGEGPRPPALGPAGGTFPPPDSGPLHARSAQEGDGVFRDFFWTKAGAADETRTVPGTPIYFAHSQVRRMVLHPHPASRFQELTLAAFDLAALRVDYVPGKADLAELGKPPETIRAGFVPKERHAALLAVFNGGFQPRHGHYGMLSQGEQLIAPRPQACTVAVMNDGTLRILPWQELQAELSRVIAYRQTPPCLVSQGDIHPRLLRADRGPWAGQQPGRKTRRRSVVGLSADGRTLFFGVGSETEPETLAEGILHAGAHHAAQLDINWNWTRLFLFAETKRRGALLPNMAIDRGQYLTREAPRGFFYLSCRPPQALTATGACAVLDVGRAEPTSND